MMSTMKYLSVLSIFALPFCQGDNSDEALHHYDAREWDVVSPLNDPCGTSRGFFGRTAKFEERIIYQYELTLKDGAYLKDAFTAPLQGPTDGDGLEGLQGVFSAVETKIADSLLRSSVFDSVCAGGEVIGPFRRSSGGGRQLRTRDERNLRAVGISSNPQDQILEGLTCGAFVNVTDGPCMVVDGEFTIYLDIYEDLDSALNSILSGLMNEQRQLDDAHPYIQKVRYIDLTADLISGSIEDETVGGQPAGNSATLGGSFYALLAAGAFIVVGTAVFYRRRRNAADHDGETTTLDQRTAQSQQPQGN